MKSGGTPDGTPLFFLHANSFSAEMYESFLAPLKIDYHILAPDLPGHGDSRWNGRIEAWADLANYYISYFEKNPPKKPMVGMGHSIGAIVIMLISIQKPEWFDKIVLLEPVLLPKRILTVIRILRLFSLTHIVPLARAANRRRNQFQSRAEALTHYSRKRNFSHWQPQFFDAYVETCLRENEAGTFQLCCDPQLESSIYQSIPLNVWSLPEKLSPQALFIIGKKSDTVDHRGFLRLKRFRGNHIVKSVPTGHLFPFECPTEAMTIIEDYLAK